MVVKFAGCYHGHVDALLAAAGSGLATFAAARTRPGVTGAQRRRHDRAALQRPRRGRAPRSPSRATEIACVITEAAAGQHGRRPAEPGLQRRSCAEICRGARRAVRLRRGDDRLPRVARRAGTASTAPSRAGPPDLMTFGKVMGGGFPAAAFGGRADVMAHARARGAGLPGRHAVREPGRHRGRAWPRCGLRHRRRLRPPRLRSRDTIAQAAADGAGRGRRAARRAVTPASMFSVFFTDAAGPRLRRRAATQDTGGVRGVLPRDARPPASTCRPARSRPGSSPPRTTTRAVDRIAATRCPRPPRGRGRCDDRPKDADDRRRPSST